jgi:hypothetical protein
MSQPSPILDYNSIIELRKNLPQICQYVRSICCVLTIKENLNCDDAVFTPFCGSLTYNYQEKDGQIYNTEADCASLETALQILGESGVQQDLLIHIFPNFETRPFLSSKAYAILRDASLLKD